jgi:hypothetical protein
MITGAAKRGYGLSIREFLRNKLPANTLPYFGFAVDGSESL